MMTFTVTEVMLTILAFATVVEIAIQLAAPY